MEESPLLPQHISVNYSSIDKRAMVKDSFKFRVTYLGSVEILISMKLLDFNTRKAIARECISLIKSNSDRRNSQTSSKYISNLICREHSDTEVNFEITDKALELKDISLNFVLVKHDMAQVSFVCGGDEDSPNYIAYVAKDWTEWRACYVVKCDSETVQNILNSMDCTFQSKYKELFGVKNDTYSTVQPKLSIKKKSKQLDGVHSTPVAKPLSPLMKKSENIEKILQSEIWYHGSITRNLAEAMIQKDGDFLVRDSQKAKGKQFVLSGLLAGQPKHLLLVDPDGKVRTKDQIFDNIPHLINHHWRNRLPIISADSTLLILRKPVRRKSLIDKRPVIT